MDNTTKSVVYKICGVGGHNADNYYYGGYPAPAGRTLPNLLMRSKC